MVWARMASANPLSATYRALLSLDAVVLVLVGCHIQERRPAKEERRHGQGKGRQVVIQVAEKAADTAQHDECVHGGFHQRRQLRRVQQCGGKQGFRMHVRVLLLSARWRS